jgi:hypothetical protein
MLMGDQQDELPSFGLVGAPDLEGNPWLLDTFRERLCVDSSRELSRGAKPR